MDSVQVNSCMSIVEDGCTNEAGKVGRHHVANEEVNSLMNFFLRALIYILFILLLLLLLSIVEDVTLFAGGFTNEEGQS